MFRFKRFFLFLHTLHLHNLYLHIILLNSIHFHFLPHSTSNLARPFSLALLSLLFPKNYYCMEAVLLPLLPHILLRTPPLSSTFSSFFFPCLLSTQSFLISLCTFFPTSNVSCLAANTTPPPPPPFLFFEFYNRFNSLLHTPTSP